MCGITGWIDICKDLLPHQKLIERMTETLKFRGPDATGLWTSSNALLGHKRLIVVDPEGGRQPMVRKVGETEYVLVYNGELYNTMELRKELENFGYEFTGHSDTEALLLAYIHWGADCVKKLNGIFAFAVWNEKEKSLFMARDRFGVKPLFYAQRDSSLIFASELKALLANPLIKAEVDSEGLAEIFALGPARTPGNGIFKNTFELKPSHYLLYDSGGTRTGCYWKLESEPHTDSLYDTEEKVKFLVSDSITRQLVSDVPLCTFLSGGLDSSAITALAAAHLKSTENRQLHTYSVDYADNDKYFKPSLFQPNSDGPWIKRMSETFETKHHYITIDTPQLATALSEAMEARDMPGMADVDSSLLLFCKEIKKEHVVSLSGECADEVFGGYPWFHSKEALEANTFPWSRALEERTKFLSKDLIEAIAPGEYIKRRYEETLAQVPVLKGEPPLEARRREMFFLNINWFMSTLLDRKDRMSMAAGLEVRVPFCDHRLVQYVWNIPWEIKAVDGREKGILRRALKDILPIDIIERKKSPYPKTHNPAYETCVSGWLREIIEDGSSPLHYLIDMTKLKSAMNSKSDYGKPWFGQLMATPQMFAYLIQVDLWMRKHKVSLV